MKSYHLHIENSLARTQSYNSKVSREILMMDGMSGQKTRHFYNNICSMNDARYLEIGTFTGSSLCSAMCNNEMTCVAIDDWSDFSGQLAKEEFMKNFNKFKGDNNATFIEKNCWDVDASTIGKFNIYMYDGDHSKESHYQALNHYMPCLDGEFIYLVDDWNIEAVRQGTEEAIKDNNCEITYQREILTTDPQRDAPFRIHPPWGPGPGVRAGRDGDWHNGISIFVLRKK